MTKEEFASLRVGDRVKASYTAKPRSVTYIYDDPSGARVVNLSAIQGCTKSITNLSYGVPDHYVNWRLAGMTSAKDSLLADGLALLGLYSIWRALCGKSRFDMPEGSGYRAGMELKAQMGMDVRETKAEREARKKKADVIWKRIEELNDKLGSGANLRNPHLREWYAERDKLRDKYYNLSNTM